MKFLIDENLPYRFKLWNTINSVHVFDLDNISSDEEIWLFATQNNLTIISKDADFSDKIITKTPPPKVIHLRIGNMKLSQLQDFLNRLWPNIYTQIKTHKLVNVYKDRIESIE